MYIKLLSKHVFIFFTKINNKYRDLQYKCSKSNFCINTHGKYTKTAADI